MKDAVCNEVEVKVCFHFSVLIVNCYRWPDEKVGSAVTNFSLSETILDRLLLIYVNLHANKVRTSQQCTLCYVDCLISSDFLVKNLTQTSFFQKSDRPTKTNFSYMFQKFRTGAAPDFTWSPNSLILLWLLLDSLAVFKKKKLQVCKM